jgi:hypothetical protein
MRTVEDLFSACGAYRLTRIQEFRPDATVQHAIVARVGDGAVLLELADAGCRVDTCFFDAERPGLLHLCVSRLDGSLPCQGFSLELAAGVWTLHDGGRDEPLRGDLASLQAILRGAPLPATTAPGTPLPSMAESPPFASPPSPPPPECAPPAAARTFGELELAPGRRYRVLAPIPAAACRDSPLASWWSSWATASSRARAATRCSSPAGPGSGSSCGSRTTTRATARCSGRCTATWRRRDGRADGRGFVAQPARSG